MARPQNIGGRGKTTTSASRWRAIISFIPYSCWWSVAQSALPQIGAGV
jgi:hypothetical protein